jgi:hypothetical protein
VTLGAIGCGEPARPAPLDAAALFAKDRAEAGNWRRFLEPRELHAAWAPPAESVWRPFYKPTLIAAVAVVKDAASPLTFPSTDPLAGLDLSRAAVFVDLPGEVSVALGAALLEKGYQPVVTFNNWPHQKGVLKLERALGALLFHAEKAAATRPEGGALPVFLLEAGRLGDKTASPGPDRFDNRYFHAVTDFPDAGRLSGRGVNRIIYINGKGTSPGAEEDDLNAYFCQLRTSGFRFTYVVPGAEGAAARDVDPVPRATIFEPARVASYASGGTGHVHRPYSHYHSYHHYWTGSSGTWGSGYSGGGGGSGGWSS